MVSKTYAALLIVGSQNNLCSLKFVFTTFSFSTNCNKNGWGLFLGTPNVSSVKNEAEG